MRIRFLAWWVLLSLCSSGACQRQTSIAPRASAVQVSQSPRASAPGAETSSSAGAARSNAIPTVADIPDFALTNEFGAPVKLRDFKGSALALTFFFTRCPLPEYCPRLSRNFAEASRTLESQASGPTNWHLLSVSFDPADTPGVLRAYARQYQYDSNRWSFITGDAAQLRALARGFGLAVMETNGTFIHDFRTVIFDANGRLQRMWPVGGDTTKLLVTELTTAARVAPADPPSQMAAHSE